MWRPCPREVAGFGPMIFVALVLFKNALALLKLAMIIGDNQKRDNLEIWNLIKKCDTALIIIRRKRSPPTADKSVREVGWLVDN
jgi:hypothetical protein